MWHVQTLPSSSISFTFQFINWLDNILKAKLNGETDFYPPRDSRKLLWLPKSEMNSTKLNSHPFTSIKSLSWIWSTTPSLNTELPRSTSSLRVCAIPQSWPTIWTSMNWDFKMKSTTSNRTLVRSNQSLVFNLLMSQSSSVTRISSTRNSMNNPRP